MTNTEALPIMLWALFVPILALTGIAGGIFLIIQGVKYKKLVIGMLGIISCTQIILPFAAWGFGEILPNIPTPVYWGIFATTGLVACILGIYNRLLPISITGAIICIVGGIGTALAAMSWI